VRSRDRALRAKVLCFAESAFLWRTETICLLFGRIIDLENFYLDIVEKQEAMTKQAVLSRLGWLNIWNPLYADIYYELDLAIRDERLMAIALVKLAIREPGENWIDETYNGQGFELPATWTQEVREVLIALEELNVGPCFVSIHIVHDTAFYSDSFLIFLFV